MRVLHNARVEEPPELGGGIVCRPGPSLADVQAGLERELRTGTDAPQHLELCDQTREAFREEARELCEHASDGMDFRSPEVTVRSGVAASGTPDEDAETAPIVVRHRFARSRPGADHGAPRVVTLRDRRKDRPRSNRHGTDPPA